MLDSPVNSFNSTYSSFSLKRLRRASSLLLHGQSHREAVTHQDYLSDSHLELRDSEPQPVLMDDWIKMKIKVPKIYLGILYVNMLASLFT
jgi:hypothetical protein